MAKSIKLKNNTYIDSTGVVHNRGLLSTLLTTLSNNVNALLGRTYIQESGTNTNGNYIKLSNGILICYHTKSYNVNFSNAWGNVYETDSFDLGRFPINLTSIPNIVINCVGGLSCWVEAVKPSTTNIGATWLMRPTNGSGQVTLSYIAIGKWK